MSDIKERFVTIYKEKIHRKGSERLLEWLEKYDFSQHRHRQDSIRHLKEDSADIACLCMKD